MTMTTEKNLTNRTPTTDATRSRSTSRAAVENELTETRTGRRHRYLHLLPPLSILVGLLIWEVAVHVGSLPTFILPPPSMIFERFVVSLRSGTLLYHSGVTMVEVFCGLIFGVLGGIVGGFILAHSPTLEQVLFPYIVASQSIPLAAIAPLLIIWLGSGPAPKILICTLVVFFPILVSVLAGLREIPRNYRDVLISMGVDRWAMLRYLEIPAVLPSFFSGLRISATLSVLGGVVGELSGAKAGLGYLINTARGQFDTAMVFVAVFMLMFWAISLYALIVQLQKRVLRWQAAK